MSATEGASSQVFTVLSNKYNFLEEKRLGTRAGNSSVNWIEYSPTSGISGDATPVSSGSTIRWDIQPSAVFVDSSPYVQADLYVTITMAADSSGANNTTHNIGTKHFPINRCLSSSVVTFNNMAEVSSNPAQLTDALALMESQDMLNMLSSAYKVSPLHTYSTANFITDILRNPADSFSGSTNNFLNWEFVQAFAGANNAGAGHPITFGIRIREKLLSRPFQYHMKEPHPFLGVSKLNVDLTFSSEMVNVIQVLLSANAAATGITQCEFRRPRLVFYGETPSLKVPVPRQCFYNTIKHVDYRASHTVTAGEAAADVATVNISSVQHNVVPKAFVLYAVRNRNIGLSAALSGNTSSTPDLFLPLENISMTFGNRQNLARNYSQQDLYNLSVKNGYNLRFPHFVNNAIGGANRANGSLVVLLPSDIGTDAYQSNMMANYVTEWQVNVDVTALANGNVFDVHVLELYDNVLEYNDGVYTERYASITPEQVVNSDVVFENVVYPDQQIMGGSFFSKLAQIGQKAWNVVKHPLFKQGVKILRNLPQTKKYAGDATDIGRTLSSLGYGKKGTKGKKSSRKKSGRGVITSGGANLSRKAMLDMLVD